MGPIKKNYIYNSILSTSRILFPLISFPYSSRVLGPDGIGKVNFVDGYTQYFCLMAALGIPIYGVREVAKIKKDPKQLSELTSELILLNFLTSVVCCVIYYLFSILTHTYQSYSELYIIGSIILIFSSFTLEWLFQGLEKFKYVSVRSIILNIISLLLLFILVKTKNDYIWYYGINLIILLSTVALNVLTLQRYTRISFNTIHIKRHLKPLILLFATQIVISIYVLLDKVILGYLTVDKYVGFYTASLRITKILLTVITALSIVMVPQMSKAFHEKDAGRIKLLYSKSFSFVSTVGIPISIGLICLSNEIITLLAGSKFLPAASSLKIIAPTIFFIGLSNIFGIQILTAMGREKLLFRCVMIGTILNVLINFLLIPTFKHNGTALSILITEFFVTLFTGYFACKSIRQRFNWRMILINVLICLPFFALYHYFILLKKPILIIAFTVLTSFAYYSIIQIKLIRDELWIEGYNKLKNLITRL